MRKTLLVAAALIAPLFTAPAPLSAQASAAQAAGKAKPSPLAPSEIVAAAPKGDWTAIPASDLLVMDLAPDAKGKPRRVVIQLMPPPFSAGWIGNIRKLAAAHWWDGMSINRVQDNYVVQWGDPNADDKAKAKALLTGLETTKESEYELNFGYCKRGQQCGPNPAAYALRKSAIKIGSIASTPDPYKVSTGFARGWPVSLTTGAFLGVAPVHCYGMVGVGRDLSQHWFGG